MNLADPELELIDPTPNIHSLFVHFDELFFCTKLLGRALVKWSKRMYSSAGVCSYEGRGGLCNIALSEPLLKLRPRKDLIETLLHEMIHAFLFITNKDNDRDGHGPNFKAHMHRINREAGLNITIYHDFHDEVELYLKHWWRCNGRCQTMKPYFGVVRRTENRPPGPKDSWWANHTKTCGGTFIKIKEPVKQKVSKKKDKPKTNADITKYLNNNIESTLKKNIHKGTNKGNKITTNININSAVPHHEKSPKDRIVPDLGRRRTNSNSVIETVRNVWINKQILSVTVAKSQTPAKYTNVPNTNKHKVDPVHEESPPKKIMKIDDYFKTTASSILKEVYGKEFVISQSNNSKKLIAVITANDKGNIKPAHVMETFVNCPNCNEKVNSDHINRHLDECLNKDIIKVLSKDFIQATPVTTSTNIVGNVHRIPPLKQKGNYDKIKTDNKVKLKKIVGDIQNIPPFNNGKIENKITTIKSEGAQNQNKLERAVSFPFYVGNFAKPSTSKEDLTQICHSCGNKVDVPMISHLDHCLGFFDNNTTIPEERASDTVTIIKAEPSTTEEDIVQKCPCCGIKVDVPIEFHLDDCIGFLYNNTTVPIEGASAIETIVIDDDEDDVFDETQTLNATGTKSPCPCCLKMIEVAEMNDHLDVCLSTSFC